MGQGTLGLQESEYYMNETDITLAYRQFMTDLATLLTNDTLTINNDVIAMYLFEKQIAEVMSYLGTWIISQNRCLSVSLDKHRTTTS